MTTGNTSITKINTGTDAYEYLKKKIDENTNKINKNIEDLLEKTIDSIRSQYIDKTNNGKKLTNAEFDSKFYSAIKNNICAFIDNGVKPSDITKGVLYSPDNFSFFYDDDEKNSSVTVSIYEVSSDNSTETQTLLFSYDEFKDTNKYLIILPFINITKKIKMSFNKSTIKGVS